MSDFDRRTFLLSAALPWLAALPAGAARAPGGSARRPAAVSSRNGRPALIRTLQRLREGADPLVAVVDGIAEVENDPEDVTVGYGGLPNEDGVVELDASVMHGPTHRAGAVAALRNIRNPARVALEVLRRTDHVLLVGEGALRFARAVGFREEDLLTDRARQAWLRWKANLNPGDDWLDDAQRPGADAGRDARTEGTIHMSAVDAEGRLAACTSTSGLSYKLPGRVGDSPIVGAGMFVDNEVGSAGATGRGEAVIQSAGAFQVVRGMAEGLEPTEACLRVLKWIADHTHRRDLLDDRGEPRFNVVFYALRKDGACGSASLRRGATWTVHDGTEARSERCPALFD